MISAFRLEGQGPAVGLALLIAACLAFGSGDALAQQKHKYFFKAPPGTTKYTQTHLLEVTDVPGHQVRLAETQSKYGDDAPVYDGVKVREIRGVLVSDYVAGNGKAFSYNVYLLENGDKVFGRNDILTHTSAGADGARRTSYTSVTTLTGGTGKFKGVRGTLRTSGATDLKTGTSGVETEGEYWFEK
jgi:hypothetical protein